MVQGGTMFAWISRGVILLWILFAVFFLQTREEVVYGRMVFLAPALTLLAVVEFSAWRSRVRKSMRDLASNLGFSFRGGVFSATLEGNAEGFPVRIRTEQSNDMGKGTCLEIELGRPMRLAVGPRRIKRRLKKASGGGSQLEGLPEPLASRATVFADASWRPFLENADNSATFDELVGRWNGAVLNDRVIACDTRGASSIAEISAFLQGGLRAAKRLRDSGVQ